MTQSSGARNTTQNPSNTHRENPTKGPIFVLLVASPAESADSTFATDLTMAQDMDMAGSVASSRTAAASCAQKLERTNQSTVFT